MRVNYDQQEVAAVRNALRTRHADLTDLIHQWNAEGVPDPDQLADAERERAAVQSAAAKLGVPS